MGGEALVTIIHSIFPNPQEPTSSPANADKAGEALDPPRNASPAAIPLTPKYAICPYTVRVPNRLSINATFHNEGSAFHPVSLAHLSIQRRAMS